MSRVPFRSASLVTSRRPPPTPGLPTLQALHGGLPPPQGPPCARECSPLPREQERVCPGSRALHSRSLGVCIRHRVTSDHCPSSSQGHPACPHLASGLSGVGGREQHSCRPWAPWSLLYFPESSQASPPHLPPAEPGSFSAATEHSRLSWPGAKSGQARTELVGENRAGCPARASLPPTDLSLSSRARGHLLPEARAGGSWVPASRVGRRGSSRADF